jgi:hypothetical protein
VRYQVPHDPDVHQRRQHSHRSEMLRY